MLLVLLYPPLPPSVALYLRYKLPPFVCVTFELSEHFDIRRVSRSVVTCSHLVYDGLVTAVIADRTSRV